MSSEDMAFMAPFLFALGSILSFRFAVSSFEGKRQGAGYTLMVLGFLCLLALIFYQPFLDFLYWMSFLE